MNNSALIGVPTAVTPPATAGSDLGYIHPVTWATKVLTVAQWKFGLDTPKIPLGWLKSVYNTDETQNNIYVTGKIVSSHSQEGISAGIIIARPDRTLKQIEALHRELQFVNTIYFIQRLYAGGLSVEEIAARFQVPLEDIQSIIDTVLSTDDLIPDTRRSLEGEFFYSSTQSDNQGFFIFSLPRGIRVDVYIVRSGFHNVKKEITLGEEISQNLGKITIFQQK